ncbi:MAG: FAD-binding oxidoreductase [Rhizobiaceae bacterium]
MTAHNEPSMGSVYDFCVIGAGIAGTSVAAELARHASVLLLEMESQPGYHTTGRSAAVFAPVYGPQPIRALTRASAAFYHNPPEDFATAPLLELLDVIMLARADQEKHLAQFLKEVGKEGAISRIGADEIRKRNPLVRETYAHAGALDQTGSGIDVHALHQGYLNTFRKAGGMLATNCKVEKLERRNGIWVIATASGVYQAATIINAAGAWADQVGAMAGAERIGLVPKRRTALIVDAPDGLDTASLPLIVDIEEQFYMKADAGRLLISPANEDPMEPCDAQPDEMDIAICIDRIQHAFDIEVRRIGNKWAGLRSFVADKVPVAGYSSAVGGFFWLAGQGGYGVQSAPALSRYAASLALGNDIPADILAAGLNPASIAPDRLRLAA